MSSPVGFLNISDLLILQQESSPLFTVPDENNTEIVDEMEDQIAKDKGVAFDLRLGDEYYLSGEDYKSSARKDQGIHIQPGQFALLITHEIFHMPKDLVGFMSMRFGIKAEGLINVSGFQVDPGFQGVFTFSVYNAGPTEINLEYKKKIFTAVFSKTSKPIKKQRKEILLGIDFDKWVKLRDKRNVSLIGLDDRIRNLESSTIRYKQFIPIIIGSIAAMAAIAGIIGSLTQ